MRPDCDYIICRQRTSWVIRHHRDIVHSTSGSEYWLCDYSQNGKVRTRNSRVESHTKNTEYIGSIQTVFLDNTPRATRNIGYHHIRLRHAPRKYGEQCDRRVAESPASGKSPDGESGVHWRTSQSCGKRGAKHPATVRNTATENKSNDSGNVDAMCCRDS